MARRRKPKPKPGAHRSPPSIATPERRLARAQRALREERWPEARREIDAALAIDPNSAAANHALALLDARVGNHQAALERLEALSESEDVSSDEAAGLWSDLGNMRLQADQIESAEAAYRRALDLDPNNARAWVNLSIALRRQDRLDDAAQACQRAIEQAPRSPLAWNALGNVYKQQELHSEAAEAYAKARRADPNAYEYAYNLGFAWLQLGRFDDAERIYRDALSLSPQRADAHQNLAWALQRQGKRQEAVESWRRALAIDPNRFELYESIATALYALEDHDGAIQAYRDWQAADPCSAGPSHMIAALEGTEVPERASDDYVKFLFDRFAETFNDSLEQLDYRAPEHVVEVVRRRFVGRLPAEILDAGCGTGWCGALLRSDKTMLVGVDLSSRMVERARATGVYDELAVSELTRYLESTSQKFDLIVSSDTVNYFGDLERLFLAASRICRPDGGVVFTVEEPPEGSDRPYSLQPHGRYCHRMNYVEDALAAAGFSAIEFEEVVLRSEAGSDVLGRVVSAVVSPE